MAQQIPAEVHKFLSENGKRGGMTTKELISMGKKYAQEHNIDLGEDFESQVETNEEYKPRRRQQ